jgi:hypothetical protein
MMSVKGPPSRKEREKGGAPAVLWGEKIGQPSRGRGLICILSAMAWFRKLSVPLPDLLNYRRDTKHRPDDKQSKYEPLAHPKVLRRKRHVQNVGPKQSFRQFAPRNPAPPRKPPRNHKRGQRYERNHKQHIKGRHCHAVMACGKNCTRTLRARSEVNGPLLLDETSRLHSSCRRRGFECKVLITTAIVAQTSEWIGKDHRSGSGQNRGIVPIRGRFGPSHPVPDLRRGRLPCGFPSC